MSSFSAYVHGCENARENIDDAGGATKRKHGLLKLLSPRGDKDKKQAKSFEESKLETLSSEFGDFVNALNEVRLPLYGCSQCARICEALAHDGVARVARAVARRRRF